jgi:hypothetical protein
VDLLGAGLRGRQVLHVEDGLPGWQNNTLTILAAKAVPADQLNRRSRRRLRGVMRRTDADPVQLGGSGGPDAEPAEAAGGRAARGGRGS